MCVMLDSTAPYAAAESARANSPSVPPNSFPGFIQHQLPLAHQARQASLQRFLLHDLIPRLQLEIVRIIRRPAEAERDNVIELKSVVVRFCPASGVKLVPLDLLRHAKRRTNRLSPPRLADCSRDRRLRDGPVDEQFFGEGGRD